MGGFKRKENTILAICFLPFLVIFLRICVSILAFAFFLFSSYA